MDVFAFRDGIVGEYEAFSRSFTKIRAEDIRAHVDEAYGVGRFWPSPLTQLNPNFVAGGRVEDFVSEGLLHPECAKIFRAGKTVEDGSGSAMTLHKHQEDAIRAAKTGQSYVLTTGTGSGKSLSYFIPIVDDVLRRKAAGESTKGISAIVLVDALVCTHNDADHSRGILGFLESELTCREVWLPALWADRLDDLLSEPGRFVEELLGQIGELRHPDKRGVRSVPLERLGDDYALARADEFPGEGRDTEEPNTAEGEPEPSGLPDEAGSDAVQSHRWRPYAFEVALQWEPLFCDEHRWRWELLQEALDAAKAIRDIAKAALHRGIPIRWFRYSESRGQGGKPNFLIPLNAVEVGYTRRRMVPVLDHIALSMANRLSLVFSSPPGPAWPGVIFSATRVSSLRHLFLGSRGRS